MFKTLIVEDNVPFRQSLKAVLDTEFPSMDIAEAANGTEALEKVNTFSPDLIFMDIKLPGINGLELTKKIKGDNASIVIIILTSYDLSEYRAAAEEYGADHFIPKGSSSREELLKLVQSVLSDQ
jgi:YesN/AraC family two-component response regulator